MTNILDKRVMMDFNELGKKVSDIRKMKKISQTELSQNLHISRATISSFENGNGVDIGLKKVLQILDYLGYECEFKEKLPFPVFEEILNAR